MRKFSSYVNESKGMLDISILPLSKMLTSDSKKEEFISSEMSIEAKTDGIKVTVLKINDTGEFSKDWIIAYKGNVLFDGEYEFTSKTHIKNVSNGSAQFKILIDHFKSLGDVNVPKGEYFIEFLMRKDTLSSNYAIRHNLILIGFSKSSYSIKNGKLFTTPQGMDTSNREKFAKILKIKSPSLLFKGYINSPIMFEKGIINKDLKKLFNEYKNTINWSLTDSIITNLSSMVLAIPSDFGGKEEGVVIKYDNKITKIQQDYQVDQGARAEIKSKTRGTPEEETTYWNNVRLKAFEIINNIRITDLPKALKDLSLILKTTKITFEHPIKNKDSILEDIQLTTKSLMIRKLKGNNGALYLGKFRVLTKAHYDIIKKALKDYDSVNVVLVTSKDTENTRLLRMKMLKTSFGDKINIQESTSGNLITLINKFNDNINVVLAGSDRVASYKEQLKRNPDVSVIETPRTNDDISATKVIANIEDQKFFNSNVPKELHGMYEEIKKTYQQASL
jgi:nicotinamide mononucleotide adenylyltransferase